jgi:hypothetical protein
MAAGNVEEFIECLGIAAAARCDQDALRGGEKLATVGTTSGNQASGAGNRSEGEVRGVLDHVT